MARKIMGVDSFFHPKIGGGWLFYALSAYSKGLPSCPPSSSPVVNFQPIGANFRQKVAKVNNFLVRFGVSSEFSETKKGKSEIYFGFGAFVVLLSSSFVVAVVVSTGCRWCAPAPSLWVCSVPFSLPLSSFLLCLWCIALEYGSISHFKGVFSAFWGADVCLYRLRSLRGLWGFCVRERLGGFMACGVFAPIFSFFHLLRLSSWALPLLSLACPLVCLVCSCVIVGFVFSFSLTVYAQKERALRVWCVLSRPVVCISLSDLFNILGKI